jgi:hypothetical protein
MRHQVPSDSQSDLLQKRHLLVALGVTTAVWIPMFAVRISAHQANVDDFAYAALTRHLLHSADIVTALLHTGQNAPLVPALVLPGVAIDGVYGAMAVELPILLLLVAGTFVLARNWLSPWPAVVTSLLVSLNEAALSYSVMLNFALAATAAVVWCFASYVKSERFQSWPWSLIFGIAFAALLLSRTVAPVYAVPLVVAVLADLIIGWRTHPPRGVLPMVAAIAVVLIVAGPWWLVSGSNAIHYLLNAGYQPSSGFTAHGADLSPSTIVQRSRLELTNLGWTQSVFLAVAVITALWAIFRHRSELRLTRLWMLAVWAILTLLVLSSSDNPGTAFGLPVLAIVVFLCAVVLAQWVRRWPLALVVAVVALFVGITAEFSSSTDGWWHGPPYRLGVIAAGGTARTNVDQLDAQVARAVGPSTALLAVNSPILNGNGLDWYALPTARIESPNSSEIAVKGLPYSRYLITGNFSYVYAPLIEQSVVESAAFRDGFKPLRSWTMEGGDSVLLWERGLRKAHVLVGPPKTRVLSPKANSSLSGSKFLVASASGTIGIARVEFDITGGSLRSPLIVSAQPFPYGWIGGLQTTDLPNGRYAVTSVATDPDGKSSRSRAVSFRIVN